MSLARAGATMQHHSHASRARWRARNVREHSDAFGRIRLNIPPHSDQHMAAPRERSGAFWQAFGCNPVNVRAHRANVRPRLGELCRCIQAFVRSHPCKHSGASREFWRIRANVRAPSGEQSGAFGQAFGRIVRPFGRIARTFWCIRVSARAHSGGRTCAHGRTFGRIARMFGRIARTFGHIHTNVLLHSYDRSGAFEWPFFGRLPVWSCAAFQRSTL